MSDTGKVQTGWQRTNLTCHCLCARVMFLNNQLFDADGTTVLEMWNISSDSIFPHLMAILLREHGFLMNCFGTKLKDYVTKNRFFP